MLKATGIVRRVDELGRVVLPIELRRSLGINEADPMEIYTDDGKVILRKYQPGCVFCGSVEGTSPVNEKFICKSCLAKVNKLNEMIG